MALVSAYAGLNLGDDLFVRTLLDKYKERNVDFCLLVYDIEKYQHLLEEYSNLILIENPVVPFANKALAKLIEMFGGSVKYRQNNINKTYMPLSDLRFDLFVNILGSGFAEYKGEKITSGLLCEEALIKNICANKKALLNTNFGPYETEAYKNRVKELYRQYDQVIFRDKWSYELFGDLKNTELASDIVFEFDYGQYVDLKKMGNVPDENSIVVNVINLRDNKRTYQERKNHIERYEETIGDLIKILLSQGKKICLIGFEYKKTEKEYIDKIIADHKKLGHIEGIIYDGGNLRKILEFYVRASAVISTRFHSMILGIVMQKVQYIICYDQKMTHFLSSINYKGKFVELSTIDRAEDIVEYIETASYDIEQSTYCSRKNMRYFEYIDAVLGGNEQ